MRSRFLFLWWGTLLMLAATALAGLSDEAHRAILERANAKLQSQDLAGSEADFTEIIRGRPDDGEAYLGRAFARHMASNLRAALEDYSKAIEVAQGTLGAGHPGLGNLYLNRGKAQLDGEKWDEALADYSNALKCNPSLAPAYVSRGFVWQIKGDLKQAVADYDEMIRREPQFSPAFRLRASALQMQGNWRGAIPDLQSFIRLEPAQASYAYFFIWISRARLGEQSAGDAELERHSVNLADNPATEWEAKIARFLLGQLSEKEFLNATVSPDAAIEKGRSCHAWYYGGVKRLLVNDRTGAAERFRKCLGTNQKGLTEYQLALNELKTLE